MRLTEFAWNSGTIVSPLLRPAMGSVLTYLYSDTSFYASITVSDVSLSQYQWAEQRESKPIIVCGKRVLPIIMVREGVKVAFNCDRMALMSESLISVS